MRKHHKEGRGGNVTGWYPWVITRETLALQRYEKEHPDAQSASPQPK